MRKNIPIPFPFIGLLAFVSCKGTSENKITAGADTVQTEKPQPGTIHLTRAELLKKIADHKGHSKKWEYPGDKPAIVDFYTDWYGPCRMAVPILEELSKEYIGEIYIYKVGIDKEPELTKVFGIQSIPTLWFVPMKGEPQVSMGALPRGRLRGYIDKALLKP